MKTKQTWAERIKKRNKMGFSLVELIVVIAIMAIMTAVLAPSLLSYVERSRAQKDDSAMSEVVNSIMLALADQNVYDEVLCYTATDNVSCYVDSLATYNESHASYTPTKKSGETVLQYMFNDDARREDENPYAPAGVMRGVTITFEPEQSTNKSCFVLYNGIINKFGPTDFIYGEMPESEANDDDELLLGGMASFSRPNHHYLYNRIRSTVGDKIELTSQTYRNSEYTVFIRIGTTGGGQADKQDAIAVYGQWSGTNLSYGNTGAPEEIPPIGIILVPGLYETGTSTMIKSWDELKSDGSITLNDDELVGSNPSALIGDLVFSNDVTKIDDNAFSGCAGLTFVTISESVTKINKNAFAGCTSLPSIAIPSSVIKIGDNAFDGCTSLEEVTLLDGIASIGHDVFIGCNKLAYNTYDNAKYLGNEKNPYVALISATSESISSCQIHQNTKIIGGDAFSKCINIISIDVPNSVITIGKEAFYRCESMTSVTIGNSVTTIEEYAFSYCKKLDNVVIGNSVTKIDADAFKHCEGLTSITITDNITTIPAYMFSDCDKLTNITFLGTKEQWNEIEFGDKWNYLCGEITVTCIDNEIITIQAYS